MTSSVDAIFGQPNVLALKMKKKILKKLMGESNHSNYKLKNFKLHTSSSEPY